MKLKRIFAIDGNWYLWRSFHTTKTSRALNEVLPYNLLSLICKDAVAVRADYVMVGFDGNKVFRHTIYPEYKANRSGKAASPSDDDTDHDGTTIKDMVYGCLPDIYNLFNSVGLVYYTPRKREADDVLCSVARHYGPIYKVICGAQDKDAYQYLENPNVILYDSSAKSKDGKRKPKYIGRAEAEKKKGVKVEQMVDFQTLIGDELDNVMPIKGMTPGRAKKILAEYGSIRNWYKKDKESKAFITSQLERLRLNRQLVTLMDDAVPPTEVEEWKLLRKKPNDKYLSRSFHELHLQLWPKTKGLFR